MESSAFLFIGEDGYLKEKAIEDLASSLLDSSSRQLDYKIFYCPEADARSILEYATTIPFLAPKRVTVVKDVEKLSKEDISKLTAYLKNPSKSTCLVLESKDDSMLKEFSETGLKVQRFDDLEGYELLSWVRQYVAKKGKSISEDAARELKELQGANLLSTAQELDKLIAFIGDRHEIETGDIEGLVGKSLIISAFDLTRSIESNRIDDAIRTVSDLMLGGKRPHEIIGLLCWHFTRILRAKVLLSRGESVSHISSILRVGRRYSDDFFQQVKRFTDSEIKSKIRGLLEADLDIKRTKFDPALILEFVIIRLCLS